MSTAVLRNLIRHSDLDGLEEVVLDGHGQKLIGENASDSKIRTFIKAVPSYMVNRNDFLPDPQRNCQFYREKSSFCTKLWSMVT